MQGKLFKGRFPNRKFGVNVNQQLIIMPNQHDADWALSFFNF